MIMSVVLIVFTFILCNSFESILFMLSYLGWLKRIDIFSDYLRPTANFLMVLNCSVNSFIYGICSTSFRDKFAEMYLCHFCKKSKLPSVPSRTQSSSLLQMQNLSVHPPRPMPPRESRPLSLLPTRKSTLWTYHTRQGTQLNDPAHTDIWND